MIAVTSGSAVCFANTALDGIVSCRIETRGCVVYGEPVAVTRESPQECDLYFELVAQLISRASSVLISPLWCHLRAVINSTRACYLLRRFVFAPTVP